MLNHLHATEIAPGRVVILGSTGFIGGKLMEALNEAGVETLGLGSADVDLCQDGACKKLAAVLSAEDTVIFASGLTPNKGKGLDTFLANLKMASEVADAVQQTPCAHLIYISSDAVYGGLAGPNNEQTPCDPGDLYGTMHVTREKIVRFAAEQASVPFAALRPCAIYGVGDPHCGYGPNRFFKQAQEDKKIPLFGGGEETRDHIAIGDVVELIRLAIFHKSEGVLNLSTGNSVSFDDVAKQVAELVGEGTEIAHSERQNPVTHISYDPTEVYKCFPNFSTTELGDGLKQVWSKLQ